LAVEDEFNAVSSTRRDEVRRLAIVTYEKRCQWISASAPSAAAIIQRYKKFLTVPDMVCSGQV